MTQATTQSYRGSLLPIVIDQRAKDTPDRAYAITPKTDRLEDGYENTTYAQVARAVNKLAWWLDDKLGKSTDGFEAIAYIGPRDLRYVFIINAAVKTHRKTLVPLTQNSHEAHLNLVNATKTKALIGTPETMHIWNKIREVKPDVNILTMPELKDLINDEPVEHYPYNKTWEEAKNDPVHINHTSGTTGLPKPVEWSYSICALFDFDRVLLANDPTRKSTWLMYSERKILAIMPPEWIAGLATYLHFPIMLGTIPILLPTTAPHPLTPAYIDHVHRAAPQDAYGGLYVPDLLKQLVKTPAYLDNMGHMETIFFGGAPLDGAVGDILARTFKVQAVMGSTELGAFPQLEADPGEWRYYRFDLAHPAGVRMHPYADGLHEMVVERLPGQEDFQNIFKLHPELQLYHTKDLFREHPTKQGLWLFSGRTDDFVKLANLTKFNASHVEAVIARHPLVRDVIMGGEGRERPFCLVQLDDAAAGRDQQAVLDEVWTAFEEANKNSANDIQLSKNMILFAKAEKPIRKTGKNTINRRATLADYDEEIQALYAKAV